MYEPSAERVTAINEAASDAANPLEAHYDASKEVRAKGAAFYAFSKDEETRRKQMEELKASRTETEQTRKETGAVDAKSGETEGMRAGMDDDEKEEEDEGDYEEDYEEVVMPRSKANGKRKADSEERSESVETKRRKSGTNGPSEEDNDDPFALLERNFGSTASKKDAGQSDADRFLAELERDVLGSKAKR